PAWSAASAIFIINSSYLLSLLPIRVECPLWTNVVLSELCSRFAASLKSCFHAGLRAEYNLHWFLMRRIFSKCILLIILLPAAVTAQDFLPELVKRIKPSAVAIEAFDSRGQTIARGSGFFVGADRIITNRHVIEEIGIASCSER